MLRAYPGHVMAVHTALLHYAQLPRCVIIRLPSRGDMVIMTTTRRRHRRNGLLRPFREAAHRLADLTEYTLVVFGLGTTLGVTLTLYLQS